MKISQHKLKYSFIFLYHMSHEISIIQKGIGLFMAIFAGVVVVEECGPGVLDYFERKQKEPVITSSDGQNIIEASPELSGYFPTRGYDYDRDGRLDMVERLYHGAPRIPFGAWKEIDGDDPLFAAVQKEYSDYFGKK
jgi:hypothetical protein